MELTDTKNHYRERGGWLDEPVEIIDAEYWYCEHCDHEIVIDYDQN